MPSAPGPILSSQLSVSAKPSGCVRNVTSPEVIPDLRGASPHRLSGCLAIARLGMWERPPPQPTFAGFAQGTPP